MTAVVYATECGSSRDIQDTIDRAAMIDLSALTVPQRCLMHRFACQSLRVVGHLQRAVEEGTNAHDLALQHGLHHQARVAAELLVHVFLDFEQLAAAKDWIAMSAQLSHLAVIGTTARSHEHANDRLGIQVGDFAAVCPRVLSRLPAARSSGTVPARLGEMSLAALCLSQLGRREEAAVVVDETLGALDPVLGQYSGHFAVELTARALRLLDRGDRADALLRDHATARSSRNPPRLPPFFSELAAAEEELAMKSN